MSKRKIITVVLTLIIVIAGMYIYKRFQVMSEMEELTPVEMSIKYGR